MPQLDKYLQHMVRFEAQSLLLQSNGPVVAKLAGGQEKASTQVVEHAVLVAAVQEAMPAEALADVRASRPTRFAYPPVDPQVNVEVTPTPGLWRVLLTPLPVAPKPPQRTSVRPDPTTSVLSVPPSPALGTNRPSQPAGAPVRPAASFAVVEVVAPPRTSVVPLGAPPSPAHGSPVASVRPSMPVREEVIAIAPRRESVAALAAVPPIAQSVPPPSSPSMPPAAPVSVPPSAPVTGPSPAVVAEPDVPTGALDTSRIDTLLKTLAKLGGSDLHLSVGRVPMARIHGSIKPLDGTWPVITQEILTQLLYATMPVANRREFVQRKDTDYAYEIKGVARFRCNAYVDRKGSAAAMRRIPEEIVPFEQLGLGKAVLDFCNLSKGLVLVTGPTGSGKSTTLATLIDRINTNRREHIITMEDPIEFVHQNKKCLVNQREIRVHTDSFRDALRAALREDPDVVLVGELRDLETMAMAIETAETGHLVFGTLHTRTAPSTVDRVIDQFPSERQGQIRTMLSESLKGVIAQTLCKKIGGGRVAAYEILVVNAAVANLIREGKVFQIPGIMQTNRAAGMITLTDSLTELVKSGKVEVREAMAKATSRAELRKALTEAGIRVPDRDNLKD